MLKEKRAYPVSTGYTLEVNRILSLYHRLWFFSIVGLLGVLAACGSNGNANSSSSSTSSNSTAATVAATKAAAATNAAAGGTAAVSAAQLPACPPSGSATSLTGAGSTFDSPLFSKLFDVYNQQC